MNRDNLQRMANYIRDIKPNKFSMSGYRNYVTYLNEIECKTIGCVIGHCTILDPDNIPFDQDGNIEFEKWSIQFTELDSHGDEWDWCFSMYWSDVDNTPKGAAERIEYLLDKGLPYNWYQQMMGDEELSYKQTEMCL